MEGRTHVVGGIAAGLAVATYADLNPILTVGAAALGSLLPDIDHAKSNISRSNPLMTLLSAVVNIFFTHRTFTHSAVFVVGTAFLLNWLHAAPPLAFGFLIGIISHLVLDAMTKNGIKLFWPLSLTFRIPFYIRTGGKVERVVEVLLMFAIVYLLADLVYPY